MVVDDNDLREALADSEFVNSFPHGDFYDWLSLMRSYRYAPEKLLSWLERQYEAFEAEDGNKEKHGG